MDVLQIMREVADRYGVTNPDFLEAGWFPPSQMKVLLQMQPQYNGSEENFRRYVQQKAKFIVARGKRTIK